MQLTELSLHMNEPDKYLNVYLPDGKWLGMFYRRDFAVEYLKERGYDPETCEISKRRPEKVSSS
jgi:hypothetical protein